MKINFFHLIHYFLICIYILPFSIKKLNLCFKLTTILYLFLISKINSQLQELYSSAFDKAVNVFSAYNNNIIKQTQGPTSFTTSNIKLIGGNIFTFNDNKIIYSKCAKNDKFVYTLFEEINIETLLETNTNYQQSYHNIINHNSVKINCKCIVLDSNHVYRLYTHYANNKINGVILKINDNGDDSIYYKNTDVLFPLSQNFTSITKNYLNVNVDSCFINSKDILQINNLQLLDISHKYEELKTTIVSVYLEYIKSNKGVSKYSINTSYVYITANSDIKPKFLNKGINVLTFCNDELSTSQLNSINSIKVFFMIDVKDTIIIIYQTELNKLQLIIYNYILDNVYYSTLLADISEIDTVEFDYKLINKKHTIIVAYSGYLFELVRYIIDISDLSNKYNYKPLSIELKSDKAILDNNNISNNYAVISSITMIGNWIIGSLSSPSMLFAYVIPDYSKNISEGYISSYINFDYDILYINDILILENNLYGDVSIFVNTFKRRYVNNLDIYHYLTNVFKINRSNDFKCFTLVNNKYKNSIKSGYYNQDNYCVMQCNSNQIYGYDTNSICKLCSYGEVVDSNKCVDKCSKNKTVDNKLNYCKTSISNFNYKDDFSYDYIIDIRQYYSYNKFYNNKKCSLSNTNLFYNDSYDNSNIMLTVNNECISVNCKNNEKFDELTLLCNPNSVNLYVNPFTKTEDYCEYNNEISDFLYFSLVYKECIKCNYNIYNLCFCKENEYIITQDNVINKNSLFFCKDYIPEDKAKDILNIYNSESLYIYKSCSNLNYYLNNECVSECLKYQYITPFRVCKYCSQEYYYYERKCYDICPNDTIPEENNGDYKYCRKKCKNNEVYDNFECRSTCLSKNKIEDYKSNKCICKDGAVEKYINNSNVLFDCNFCDLNLTFFNNECINKCPINYIKTKISFEGSDNNITNHYLCTLCLENQVMYNNKCNMSCPTGYIIEKTKVNLPYNFNNFRYINICKKCNNSLFAYNNKCFSNCPSYTVLKSYNNIKYCELCPNSKPFYYNNSCLNKCPKYFISNNITVDENVINFCLSCSENEYYFNSKCNIINNKSVNFCPENTFKLVKSIDKLNLNLCLYCNFDEFFYKGLCYKRNCPSNTIVKSIDVDYDIYINNNMFAFQNTNEKYPIQKSIKLNYCYLCEYPNYLIEYNKCVNKCSSLMTIDSLNNTCYCDQNKYYLINNLTCSITCDTSIYIKEEEPLKKCYSCPNFIEDGKCVDKCSENKDYDINKRCYCNTLFNYLLEDKSCLTECNIKGYFAVESNKNNQNNVELYNDSPNCVKCTDFIENNKCVSKCSKNMTIVNNNECICDKNYFYILDLDKCVETCPYYSIINFDNKTCTSNIDNANCLDYKIKNIEKKGGDYICIDKCPILTYSNDYKECVPCFENKNRKAWKNNECFESCPENYKRVSIKEFENSNFSTNNIYNKNYILSIKQQLIIIKLYFNDYIVNNGNICILKIIYANNNKISEDNSQEEKTINIHEDKAKCSNIYCNNNGVCKIKLNNQLNSKEEYYCECYINYSGDNCEYLKISELTEESNKLIENKLESIFNSNKESVLSEGDLTELIGITKVLNNNNSLTNIETNQKILTIANDQIINYINGINKGIINYSSAMPLYELNDIAILLNADIENRYIN